MKNYSIKWEEGFELRATTDNYKKACYALKFYGDEGDYFEDHKVVRYKGKPGDEDSYAVVARCVRCLPIEDLDRVAWQRWLPLPPLP